MHEPLKLLAIFPHPDDESLGMGGTLAKYSAEGVETHLLCATRGERGWSKPAETYPGPTALGRIREAELRCAAQHLGLREVAFLDYIDGDVDQAEPQKIIGEIASHIRRIRPQVVITFALEGNYGHPDHIALAQFVAGALVCAADATHDDAQGLPAFRVPKFYHLVDSTHVAATMTKLNGGIGMTVDGVKRQHVGWDDWAITTRIEAQDHFDTAWRATLCHQTQLPGFGPLVNQPREYLLALLGEATFLRVYSLVNGGRAVERDLFAGLRG